MLSWLKLNYLDKIYYLVIPDKNFAGLLESENYHNPLSEQKQWKNLWIIGWWPNIRRNWQGKKRYRVNQF